MPLSRVLRWRAYDYLDWQLAGPSQDNLLGISHHGRWSRTPNICIFPGTFE